MDVELLRMVERLSRIVQMMQGRLDKLAAQVQAQATERAAFEAAAIDSFTLIWDAMPQGEATRHG